MFKKNIFKKEEKHSYVYNINGNSYIKYNGYIEKKYL